MDTIALLPLILSFLFGILLGGIYFGGLWLTVRRLVHAKRPALWMLLSLVLRMALVLGALYWMADGHWQRLVAALAGLIVARVLGSYYFREREKGMKSAVDEGGLR